MHSEKRFSSATFTKRVDHEGGEHRTARGLPEPARCKLCGAVYADKRWISISAAGASKEHEAWRPARSVVCPACKQEREGVPGGVVYLAGPFLEKHLQEIERLIENESAESAEANPLARVMGRQVDEQGRMVVMTTTEHLAQHLGRAIERAFGGQLKYVFSHENKLTRVYWRHD